MRKAGIREARQNISELIESVRKGREIVITDRGRPVACLVSVERFYARPFPGRAAFRRSNPTRASLRDALERAEHAVHGLQTGSLAACRILRAAFLKTN